MKTGKLILFSLPLWNRENLLSVIFMNFQPNHLYHIYNRSINHEKLFYSHENYLFFLRKVRVQLLPHCDFLAYCLMSTHFHFLIYTHDNVDEKNFKKSIGILLRSYTSAINKQNGSHGSLFQQHTKAIQVLDYPDSNYSFICFNYIHQNPLVAGLVSKMEDWEYSSFKDYLKLRNGTICNQSLARQLLDFDDDIDLFYKTSYSVINTDKIIS